MNKKNFPEPLEIDGEIVQVVDETVRAGIGTIFVHCGPRMNLSPYEAEELRDWLTKYLEAYYDK